MTALLEVLAGHNDPVSLKQLALETRLHPSTAHRILAAMAVSGIVERSDTGAYRLGIRLLELGNLVKSRINIRDSALPLMQRLHQRVGESVNLGVRQGDEIVYVERTSSGRSSVRVVHLVGARAPLHVTAVGKLYLSEDGAEQVREYARRTGLPGFTPTSITTLPALEKELERVRRHGGAFHVGAGGTLRCRLGTPGAGNRRGHLGRHGPREARDRDIPAGLNPEAPGSAPGPGMGHREPAGAGPPVQEARRK